MRALIIDDERLARLEMRRMLAAHPEVEIAGEAATAAEARTQIAALDPDLLFLDIQMPGGTGFDLLEQLDSFPNVIFTTAFDQWAIKAFEVNALDYLLKPIAPARLAEALQRVTPRPAATRLAHVFIRDKERCWIVALKDVFLLESEGNYSRVYFGAEKPLIRRSLNGLEAQLDPTRFFRASRKHILNLAWIESTAVSVSGGLTVNLKNGQSVEISRRQAEKLQELFRL